MVRKLAAFAVIGAMIAGPTLAAEASVASLSGVQGSVMVSQNGKMASGVTALHAGDRVVAKANSSASVKFADGCVVAVKASSMLTVSAKSPCASGAGVVSSAQANSSELLDLNLSPPVEATIVFLGLAAIIVGGRASGSLSASP